MQKNFSTKEAKSISISRKTKYIYGGEDNDSLSKEYEEWDTGYMEEKFQGEDLSFVPEYITGQGI